MRTQLPWQKAEALLDWEVGADEGMGTWEFCCCDTGATLPLPPRGIAPGCASRSELLGFGIEFAGFLTAGPSERAAGRAAEAAALPLLRDGGGWHR